MTTKIDMMPQYRHLYEMALLMGVLLKPFTDMKGLIESGTEEEWISFANEYNWHEVPDLLRRIIAFNICDHCHGRHAMIPIIKTGAIYLEDFEAMAESLKNAHPVVKWEALVAIYGTAVRFNRKRYGISIAEKIEPPVWRRHLYYDPDWEYKMHLINL